MNLFISSNSAGNDSTAYDNFGTLGRSVAINLKYSKTARITQDSAGKDVRDVDGNNKQVHAYVFVKNDAYDSNLSITTFLIKNNS